MLRICSVDGLSLRERQSSMEGPRACQCDNTTPGHSVLCTLVLEVTLVICCTLVLPQVPHKQFMSVSQLCCCREESRQGCWQTV